MEKIFHGERRTLVRLQPEGAQIPFASMGPSSKVFVASHNPRKEPRNLGATTRTRCFNTSNLGYPRKMSKSLCSCDKAMAVQLMLRLGELGKGAKRRRWKLSNQTMYWNCLIRSKRSQAI